MNYTYLLRCADCSLYCGWTNRLPERVEAHNEGKGAKYTKSRRPVTLAYYECFDTKEEAMKREAAIKKLNKKEKEALVSENQRPPLKIIVSPAKKMQVKNDEMPFGSLPVLLEEAELLLAVLKEYSEEALKTLFKANDSITHENFLRFRDMELSKNLTPAVIAYVGIQYQYMSPLIFSQAEWNYICRHLRILSGFYGCLRADDGILPYRLEMQAKLHTEGADDLYGYWSDKIYKAVSANEDDPESAQKQTGSRILNLASKEYSKVVEPWLKPEDEYVTCIFGTEENGRIKVKATEAKMARGEMVRFLAERRAEDFETVKEFDRLDYSFCPEKSTGQEFIFIKEGKA